MMGGASAAQRGTVTSVVTGLLLQGVVTVSGILAARLLGVVDRGYLAVLFIVSVIVLQLGSLGVPVAITYAISAQGHDPRCLLRSIRRFGYMQALALTLVQGLTLWLALRSAPRQAWLGGLLALCIVPALLLQAYGLVVLQGLRRYRAFNEQRAVAGVLYSVGLVLAVVLGVDQYLDIVGIWVAANVAAAVATFARVLRALGPRIPCPRGPSVTRLVRFGATSLLGSFSAVGNLQLDQAIVGLLMPARALGLYVVAVAFSQLPRLLGASIGLIAYPEVAKAQHKNGGRDKMWRYLAAGIVVCGLTVAVLQLVVGALLPRLAGHAFVAAVPVARLLLLAAFFQGVRRTLSEGVRGLGHPALGSLAEISFYATCVPVLVLLVDGRDLVRIALAFSLAEGLSFTVLLGCAWFIRRPAAGTPSAAPPQLGPDF